MRPPGDTVGRLEKQLEFFFFLSSRETIRVGLCLLTIKGFLMVRVVLLTEGSMHGDILMSYHMKY
jgi:hypothetical protein